MKIRRVSVFTAALAAALFSISAIAAISADRLKEHVLWLSDPAREGRRAGSPGDAAAADYISRQLKDLGCEVQVQNFGGGRKNVVGKLGRSDRYILIGAHYDGQGPGLPSASDNAAGVAVVLELLRDLKQKNLPVSFVATAFDDEEQGLNGSRYYVDHPLYPLDNAESAIIFDTMGRQFMDLSSWTLFVLGAENSKELSAVVAKHATPEMLVVGTDLIGPRSDFAGFGLKRVPYLFFTHATHKDYHGPGDTPDRVNYPRLAQDSTFIEQIIEDIARLDAPPKFLAAPVYPPGEAAALQRELETVERERKDIPQAYRMMFADFKARLKSDDSRDVRRIATSALLALATPRLSGFMINFYLGPYFESKNRPDIAAAVYEEGLKWAEDAAERREMQERIDALHAPAGH